MFTITPDLSISILAIIFCISLFALIKGADFLLEGAERIGKYLKMPPFVIGALIVGVGTSLPELASSSFAVLDGVTDIVPANVIGSNIANILLVAGLAAVIGGVISTTKNLVKLEIPLLVISTSLFLFVAFDGVINFVEALVMLTGFIIYVTYLLNVDKYQTVHDKIDEKNKWEIENMALENGISHIDKGNKKENVAKIGSKEFVLLATGIVLLAAGASYLVDSVIAVSAKMEIATSIISVLAIAIGTSLPEILVSVKAVLKGKTDLAFGNVFGSNVFNILMLTGILGLFADLKVSKEMVETGLPFLAIATLIFYVSATAKRIYIWEGLMFLLFYALFVLKIIGL